MTFRSFWCFFLQKRAQNTTYLLEFHLVFLLSHSCPSLQKSPDIFYPGSAEEEGFEPPKGSSPLPVFKTGAINRSTTPPEIGGNALQM